MPTGRNMGGGTLFTPGGWEVRPCADRLGNVTSYDVCHLADPDVNGVAVVASVYEGEKIARLIAAAQELFGAAELATAIIEEQRRITIRSYTVLYEGSPDVGKVVDPDALEEIAEYDEALEALQAALAKARGDQ
jgi:hypothetical protein